MRRLHLTVGGLLVVLGMGYVALAVGAANAAEHWGVGTVVMAGLGGLLLLGGLSVMAGKRGADSRNDNAGWPLNRILRTLLAIVIGVGALVAAGLSLSDDQFQHCEKTTAEATVKTTETDEGVITETNDLDNDGVTMTTVCRPISGTDLIPVLLVIGLLFLPDLSKLALGDVFSVEFREMKQATESAKEEASKANEAVTRLFSFVQDLNIENAIKNVAQVSFTGFADILDAAMAGPRMGTVIMRWEAVDDPGLWGEGENYQLALSIAKRAKSGLTLTDEQLAEFMQLIEEPERRLREEVIDEDDFLARFEESTNGEPDIPDN